MLNAAAFGFHRSSKGLLHVHARAGSSCPESSYFWYIIVLAPSVFGACHVLAYVSEANSTVRIIYVTLTSSLRTHHRPRGSSGYRGRDYTKYIGSEYACDFGDLESLWAQSLFNVLSWSR